MSVSGIEAVPGLSGLFPGAQATAGVTGPTGPTGPNFADLVTNAMNDKTDRLAVGAATGDLGAIHDYTIAATETSVATQLTVAVRNKAVEAFNEIMRMQV
jgi:flagellar hook-basal body complex protein FliE